MDFQLENRLFDRIHFSYFMLAAAYFELNNLSAAEEYFNKFIYVTMLFDKSNDCKFFLENKTFYKIINSHIINNTILDEFYKKNNIIPYAKNMNGTIVP